MSAAAARPIRFGALLRQADNRWASIQTAARMADDLGFHAIHFIDHLLAIPDPAGDILESWITVSDYSRSRLATELEVSKGRVSQLIHSQEEPSAHLIAKLLTLTNLPFDRLFRIMRLNPSTLSSPLSLPSSRTSQKLVATSSRTGRP